MSSAGVSADATRLPLDGLERKFSRITSSSEWTELELAFTRASTVLLFGNGGSAAIAEHGASDVARLTGKASRAPAGTVHCTALSNDHGFDNWLRLWLSAELDASSAPVFVLGISSSGQSRNVLSALNEASARGASACLIAGRRPRSAVSARVVELRTAFYHSTEVLTLLLVYQLIEAAGGSCPALPGSGTRAPRAGAQS